MDARSIAATAVNKGFLTSAENIDVDFTKPKYFFNKSVYDNRVYQGFGKADTSVELKLGPNITDWPEMVALPENLLVKVVSLITDPVTTTDELIPSGETSSYRSNPLGLADLHFQEKTLLMLAELRKYRLLKRLLKPVTAHHRHSQKLSLLWIQSRLSLQLAEM